MRNVHIFLIFLIFLPIVILNAYLRAVCYSVLLATIIFLQSLEVFIQIPCKLQKYTEHAEHLGNRH